MPKDLERVELVAKEVPCARMSFAQMCASGSAQLDHTALIVLLDTASSSNEDDQVGVRTHTPPESSLAIQQDEALWPVTREVLADLSCVNVLVERFGVQSDAFSLAPIDLVSMLAKGNVSTLADATAIVLGPVLGNGLTAADVITQLRALLPHVGLYVVAAHSADVSRCLPKLAVAGVDEVFSFDASADVDAFEETLAHRVSAPPPETEIRLLWKWFRESPERSLVMHCVRNGFRLDLWSVRSRVFAASRKTLQNRMTFLGLPSPGIVSRCGRVLHAQELERRGVKPTSAVGVLLGFPSAGAMQRSRRRLRKALMLRGRQALVLASLLK